MTRKQKALRIAEMWDTIANAESTLGFWCKTQYGTWVQMDTAPDFWSSVENWKVAPFEGVRMETKIAKYFAKLWLDVSEGANFLCWDDDDSSWKMVQSSAPCYYDSMEDWTITWKSDPVSYIWKRVDNGELTENRNQASQWKSKGYRIQQYVLNPYALVEQA